ncbi:LTXXQ motif family protein [Tangfeifania diversioriginum]|uniref:LTXXQ motif family protein n=1 Tax=Tangfeifania diversioriginum TaxID=1168035 RepID=A0A1M6P0G8_9BACT|nr:Spy/CpxP family protein refolding chaperone [Tangfeifania diversioriginum]SHK01455.1 LTXXQ motif family protein [Tangfeifania diversioriginum]
MKTKNFVWMFIALMLTSTTLLAQGRRNVNQSAYGYGYGQGTCLAVLTDLTEEQQAKITELEAAHQKAMAELRVEQRSTFEPVEKSEIRTEMLKKVQAHRNEVRNLLTGEQQKQYDLLQARNNYGRKGFAQGRRGGRGQAASQGRGGRGCGFRGNW